MKIYNSVGSKERLVEMFQKVNKINLNEDMLRGNVIENEFNALKNNELNIKQTNNQAKGNQNIIEIVATDREGGEITFRFRVTGNQNDQDGVVVIDNAELMGFNYKSRAYQMEIPEGMNSLVDFNRKFGSEIADVVGDFADFSTSQASDELYEDAINLIDGIKVDEINQEFDDENDNEFTDDDYTREVEPEDPLAMPPDYSDMENPYGDDNGEELEGEEDPEAQALFAQAFDSLMARNKTSRNPNYYPTRPEIEKEMIKLKPQVEPKREKPRGVGNMMAVGKKRVYPAFADKFLTEENPANAVVVNSFNKLLSSDKKGEIIRKAKQYIDTRFGNRISQISKEEYLKLIQQTALTIYHHGLHNNTNFFGIKDLNETDYPKEMEIGKEFSTGSKYPKPKKHRVKKIKIGVDENDESNDGMSLEPKGDEVAQLAQNKEERGEVLQGGKGDGKSPLEFEPDQIIMGMKVESEHTDDPMIAIEIVLDHLSEDPEYYTRKDDPETSAQFGASADAENGNIGIGMSHAMDNTTGNYSQSFGVNTKGEKHPLVDILDTNDETTDVLLGYKPKNVGDGIEETMIGAANATSAVGGSGNETNSNDELNKYQEYKTKNIKSLSDSEKKEYFDLWTKFEANNK